MSTSFRSEGAVYTEELDVLETLRVQVIRPLIELLQLVPPPWRFTVEMLGALLLLRLLPLGTLIRPVAWLFRSFFEAVRHATNWGQSFCANRPPSALIDTIDTAMEFVIQQCSRLIAWLQARSQLPKRWGRLQKRWVFLLALLPIGLWFSRLYLGDISVARALDGSFTQWESFEGWALTRQWKPLAVEQRTLAPLPQQATDIPPTPEEAIATALPAASDPSYIVKRGDLLWNIAQEYGIDMKCIIEANQERYPRLNPNSLKIGMELRIPTSDPSCKK